MIFKCDGCSHYSKAQNNCSAYHMSVDDITIECTGYGYANFGEDNFIKQINKMNEPNK